ncbi:MAG: phosphoribosylglycinamide formyltransferase, partial [Actinobacteria bacterium]
MITDRDGVAALERADRAGIPTEVFRYGDFAGREEFSAAIVDSAERYGAEALVLAGFMRILSPIAIDRYRNRILNIHPS